MLNVFPVRTPTDLGKTCKLHTSEPTEVPPFIKYSVKLKQLNPNQTAWANVVISQTSLSESRAEAKFKSGVTRG